MDNRVFNVNGSGDQMLLAALQLVFQQIGANTRCKAWKETKHGLILAWYADGAVTPLPAENGLTAAEVFPMVLAWLASDSAKGVVMDGWDSDEDHDGDNSIGWRVYCEDWGHVGEVRSAICAVKPAFMWHGK